MAFFNWDDSYSVGVREIDVQHQKLVKSINDLHDAMKEGKGKQVIGDIINNLVSYTSFHFKTEEKYFDQFKYPETAAHKKEHVDFVAKVGDFKTGYDKGDLSLSLSVMNFLSDWLKNHIKGTDQKYTKFFNDKGLK